MHPWTLRPQSGWPVHAQGASGERWRGAVQSQRKPKLADENLQISLVQQALGIAAAACMLVAPCHADVNTALSFNKNCIGCHVGGGNVVQASETLKEGDLKRNGVASAEAIYDLVYNGKGKMPGYGLTCAPKGRCTFGPRLSDDEIQRLSQYVVDQAAAGWK